MRVRALCPVVVALLLSGAALAQEAGPQPADASLGEVLDREGSGALRRALSPRWCMAEPGSQLAPGDLLKTASRGANALQVALRQGQARAELLLGPGAMVELVEAGSLRLHRGEAELVVPEGSRWSVAGPTGEPRALSGRTVLRAREALSLLDEDPAWLRGYRQHASTEALGSLVAQVDGRDVALTIGYHKVDVDIRDQIARTTVEQSFVNHTATVLEGVFYFPLPQDASISGFAMWIGDEQVHGEVVEKQRARAIYEQILRERRDPGLLEWSGGNLFKARVFPIGHEKRIKITYTQVLPRQGDGYRYRYALRAEHLREHPLAKLEVTVRVHSAQGLEAVEVPGHACRIQTSEHAAQVELSQEEVVPERDFELRVKLPPAAALGGVTCVSHVRDAVSDEAYLMLLLDAPPASDAAIARRPLDVIVIADTSGSLYGPQRGAQLAFVEALLEGLGDDDAFRVLTVDTEVRELARAGNSAEARLAALRFVAAREPLGWSNLDAAVARAVALARPETQVVYVGDGAFTAGDPDPNACAERLRALYRGQGSFHAVVPGSGAEPAVLRAISRLGGGSLRELGDDPTQAAFDLLDEVSRPAVKGLQVGFEGLEVAAVYPRELPNLPAGGQQVVLARWNPGAQPSQGAVTIRGSYQGKPLEQRQAITLDPAVEGNSFLPRLWARRHLDHLLEQGRDARTQQRVIALSEDFQIMTPYTSFLVLESDEDRRRFQVEKRFRMRDGEAFFAEGRAQGGHELQREQLLAAKGWRLNLVKRLVQQLADMGRDLTRPVYASQAGAWGRAEYALGAAKKGELSFGDEDDKDADGAEPASETEGADAAPEAEAAEEDQAFREDRAEPVLDAPAAASPAPSRSRQMEKRAYGGRAGNVAQEAVSARLSYAPAGPRPNTPFDVNLIPVATVAPPVHGPALSQLFPQPGAPRGAEPAWTWAEEPKAALLATQRRNWLLELEGGLRVTARVSAGADGLEPVGTGESVLASRAWLVASLHAPSTGYQLSWWTGAERGVLDTTWGLGRVRPAREGDAGAYGEPIPWCFGDSLINLAGYTLRKAEPTDAGLRVELVAPQQVLVLLVDTTRALILSVETWRDDVRVSTQRLSEPVELDGVWLPTRLETLDADGKVRRRVDYTLTRLDAGQVDAALATVPRGRAILVGELPATPAEAQAQLERGERVAEARLVLLDRAAATQRWDLAWEQLAAFVEAAGAERDGRTLLEGQLATLSGRRERLRQLALAQAAELAETPDAAEDSRSQTLVGWSYQFGTGEERLELLALLEPVARRQPAQLDVEWRFEQQRLQALLASNRWPEAIVVAERLLEAHPERSQAYAQLAQALTQQQRIDEAVAVWKRALSREGWSAPELASLYQQAAYQLHTQRRLEELLELVEGWDEPEGDYGWTQIEAMRLSALIMLDREPEALAQAEAWLGVEDGSISPAQVQRFLAASQLLLGQGYGLYRSGQLERAQAEILARAVRAAADHAELTPAADGIMGHWTFRQAREGRETARWARHTAAADAAAGDVQRLACLLRWGSWAEVEGQAAELPTQESIYRALLQRWKQTPAGPERDALFDLVQGSGLPELQLASWRALRKAAQEPAARRAAAVGLLGVLLNQPWTSALGEEAQALLSQVGPLQGPPDEEHQQQLLLLVQWIDWSVAGEARVSLESLEGREQLSRRQLAAARGDAERTARQRAVGLLLELRGALGQPALEPWLELERIWFQVKLGADLPEARRAATAVLGAALGQDDRARSTAAAHEERRLLAARALTTLIHLAVEGQDAEACAALLARCQASIEAENELLDWRKAQYVLLLTSGQIEPLRALLVGWADDGTPDDVLRWGQVLGYLQAELDQLDEAAQTFERLAARDAVSSADLQTLAGWYTALDQAERAEDARRRAWELLDEWQLQNQIQQALNAASRRGDGVPEDLSPEVAVQLLALMRKTAYPGNHMWLLGQLYRTTRDFRVLRCLPEGFLGRTAQEIYPALSNARDLIGSIQEEATLDQLLAHLVTLRTRAASDVDRRALELLESQCASKGAAQAQGAGPHARRALTALQAAFKGAWEDGERQRYAQYLGDLQELAQPELRVERLKQLRALRELTPLGTLERLNVSLPLANVLWREGQPDDAILLLQETLAVREGEQGWLPAPAQAAISTLGSYLLDRGRFAEAEALYVLELRLDPPEQLRRWHSVQLYQVYWRALGDGRGRTSLGQGAELFAGARARILADLQSRTDENHTQQVTQALVQLFRVAQQQKLPVREPLVDFAFQVLPKVLARYQYRNGQSAVGNVADTLRDLLDPTVALSFLVTRAETEPSWLRWQNQDFWPQHAWRLGDLRQRIGTLPGELGQRLLSLVLAHLDRDLRVDRRSQRPLCERHSGHFWAAHAGRYLATALRVAQDLRDDEPSLLFVCQYLAHGLDAWAEAAEVLEAALERGALSDTGREQLVGYLHHEGRFADSIPLLEQLLAHQPERVDLIALIMRAAHRVQDAKLLRAWFETGWAMVQAVHLERPEAHAALGSACLEVGYTREALTCLESAIGLHTRTRPNRGVGDGVLSTYYRTLSQTYSQLGETVKAVDAACGAIVSWGGDRHQRQQELQNLAQVLRAAKDLPAYLEHLNAEVAETGLENPLLRKALGQAFAERGELAAAEAQLRLSLEVQPQDEETHQALVRVLDRAGQTAAATEALMALARGAGVDSQAWAQVGQRYAQAGDAAAAERAFTSLVELQPNEASSHQALAELRQSQGRLDDAALHWRQVIRIRTDEPTGWLGLAEVQLQQQRVEEARQTLDHLRRTRWPDHFNNVEARVRQLERRLR